MWAETPVLIAAALTLALWAVVLICTDLRQRRLPDPLTVPPAVVALVTTALLEPAVLAAGLIWPAVYLALGLTLGGIGGGDLKLAVPLGMLTAACAGAGGVLLALAVAGLTSTVTALHRGDTPHGPAMFWGAGVAVVWAVAPGFSLPGG